MVGRLPAAARNRPRVLWSSLGHIRVGTVVGPAPAARALMVRISGRSETGPNGRKSRNLCFPRFRAHGSSYPGLRNLAMGWEMHFHFRGFPGPYVVAGAPPHSAPPLCGGRGRRRRRRRSKPSPAPRPAAKRCRGLDIFSHAAARPHPALNPPPARFARRAAKDVVASGHDPPGMPPNPRLQARACCRQSYRLSRSAYVGISHSSK